MRAEHWNEYATKANAIELYEGVYVLKPLDKPVWITAHDCRLFVRHEDLQFVERTYGDGVIPLGPNDGIMHVCGSEKLDNFVTVSRSGGRRHSEDDFVEGALLGGLLL